jgi:hypothetical protein
MEDLAMHFGESPAAVTPAPDILRSQGFPFQTESHQAVDA